MNTEKQNNLEPANDENPNNLPPKVEQNNPNPFGMSVKVFLFICVSLALFKCAFGDSKSDEQSVQTTQTTQQTANTTTVTTPSKVDSATTTEVKQEDGQAKFNEYLARQARLAGIEPTTTMTKVVEEPVKKKTAEDRLFEKVDSIPLEGDMSGADFLPFGSKSTGLGSFMNKNNLKFGKLDLECDDGKCVIWASLTFNGRPRYGNDTHCGMVIFAESTSKSGFKHWTYRNGNLGGKLLKRGNKNEILNKIAYENDRFAGC